MSIKQKLILLFLLALSTISHAESITSNYTPVCKYSGASKSPKNQFKFLVKFKFSHSGSLADGSWEQIFSGYCDLKGDDDEISIVTLSGPIKSIGFDVTHLGPRDFKCVNRGGVVFMSWGIHAVTINQATKKANYTSEEGVNVETSCE